jgi:small subunit ribosomal protein S9
MPTDTIQTTGRRKTAVARIKLVPGKGVLKINDRDFEDYFPTTTLRNHALRPLVIADVLKKYDTHAKTHGGGLNGQAGALSHALARALVKAEPESKAALKKQGLLTRDSRMKERKKSGQPGARKRFQFSKR